MQAGRRDGARSIGIVLAGGGAHIPAIRNAITKRRWTGPGMRIKHLPGTPAWVSALGDAQAYEALFSQVSAAFGAAASAPEPADDEKGQPETTRHEPAKRGVLG